MTPMKLLVFAHVPPPHHGQSYMVQLMLNGFGGDRRIKKNRLQEPNPLGIECYHVNARYSKTLEDIGEFQSINLLRLFLFCLEAIWCRFRYGVENFYYVPAPGKKVALYRDWLVMLLCRPFFKRIILHWHAAGLAKWLETSAQIRWRAVSCRLFKPVDLSIVLAKYNIADAEKLLSRRICVIGNGIPNPCPDFEKEVLPRRKARLAARAKLVAGQKLTPADLENTGGDPHRFRVLFLAHCTRQKGLFDTLDGVALASERLLRTGSPIRIYLTVAGEFFDPRERIEFEQRIAQPDLQFPVGPRPAFNPTVRYLYRFCKWCGQASRLHRVRLFLFSDLLPCGKFRPGIGGSHGLRPAHCHHPLAFHP